MLEKEREVLHFSLSRGNSPALVGKEKAKTKENNASCGSSASVSAGIHSNEVLLKSQKGLSFHC